MNSVGAYPASASFRFIERCRFLHHHPVRPLDGSHIPDLIAGEDLGEFIEGQMAQTFEDAVWASEVETVPTNFIKTQFGFHVLWVHSIVLPE